VSPLAAHALGEGDERHAGRVAAAGMRLALVLMIPLVLLVLSFERLLLALGYEAGLAAEVGRFLEAIVWGAPPFLLSGVLRPFVTAAGRTRPILVVLLLCVPVNAALNWVLIYGNLGAPALGVAGSGYATAAVSWASAVLVAGYILAMPSLARMRPFAGIFRWSWGEVAAILRLGGPIAGIYALEMGVFTTTGVLMGLLGPAALGGHQLALNFASLTFMVPLGIGHAATVRVAFELGAGRPAVARRAGQVALALGATFMTTMAVVMWCFPAAIVGLYVDVAEPANREMVGIGLRLLAIAAVFQLFDALQTVAAGTLRGYKDTAFPMLLAAIGYWGVGFAGGWALAFPLGLGAVGLWWGLALGLAVVATLLTLRFHLMGAGAPAALVEATR
jgi:MATE family multidrug resistance protein